MEIAIASDAAHLSANSDVAEANNLMVRWPPLAAFLLETPMSQPVQPERPAVPHGVAPRLKRSDILPKSLPPRGLSRAESAAYIGVSPSLFDILVTDGRMPLPKRINGRTVWDRQRLDRAFEALPDDGNDLNPWDAPAE